MLQFEITSPYIRGQDTQIRQAGASEASEPRKTQVEIDITSFPQIRRIIIMKPILFEVNLPGLGFFRSYKLLGQEVYIRIEFKNYSFIRFIHFIRFSFQIQYYSIPASFASFASFASSIYRYYKIQLHSLHWLHSLQVCTHITKYNFIRFIHFIRFKYIQILQNIASFASLASFTSSMYTYYKI